MSFGGLTIELTFAGILLAWIILFRKKHNITANNLGYRPIEKPKVDHWFYYLIITCFAIACVGFIGLLVLGIIILPVNLLILVLSFAYACICAPVTEEFIFRGYLYKRSSDMFEDKKWTFEQELLKKPPFLIFKEYELYYATLFTSILFGFFHLIGGLTIDNFIQVGYTFIGGLLFCRFKNQTHSIYTSMLFHAGWNGAMGLIGIVAISFGWIEGNIFSAFI